MFVYVRVCMYRCSRTHLRAMALANSCLRMQYARSMLHNVQGRECVFVHKGHVYELGNDVCVHVCHLEHVPVHSYVDERIRVHSLTGCSSLCMAI